MKHDLKIWDSWNDDQWVTFRTSLKTFLKEHVCEVTFTKKDGDKRIMTCTLDNTLVPVVELEEGAEPKKPRGLKNPNNTLSVYDINAKGWRSFVIKNVTAVSYGEQ